MGAKNKCRGCKKKILGVQEKFCRRCKKKNSRGASIFQGEHETKSPRFALENFAAPGQMSVSAPAVTARGRGVNGFYGCALLAGNTIFFKRSMAVLVRSNLFYSLAEKNGQTICRKGHSPPP